jgi:predicted AlkP superfamily pyrophosphatase or phosphodiesterase
VDALPLKYVNPNYTPYLFNLLREVGGRVYVLQNIPGYSFGIQSTLLSGLLPQESYHWMPYMFKSVEEETHFINYMKNVCEYNPLICNDIIKRALHVFRNTKFNNVKLLYEALLHVMVFWNTRGVKLRGIPPEHFEKIFIFPYFYMNENPFFVMLKRGIERKSDIKVYYIGHSLSKNIEKLPILLSTIKETSRLFIFAYIDDLDGIGHKIGVASREWLNTLKQIDFFIYRMYRDLSAISKHVKILIFSDHGMCNADEYIDLENFLINKLSNRAIDYIIDATLAFIRVHTSSLKDSVFNLLKRKLKDKALILDIEEDKEVLKRHGIYFANGEYGDIIVQTKRCKGFFPSSYSITRKLVGLHGFWPTESTHQAFIFSLFMERRSCRDLHHVKDLRDYILCQL